LKDGKQSIPAHRLAWEFFRGSISFGYQIDHNCRVPSCMNPNHLEPVTFYENWRRGVSYTAINLAKVYCIHGHEFTDENTYFMPSGGRRCRECDRESGRKWYRERGKALRSSEGVTKNADTFYHRRG
jgi:hypothetical protein